MTAPLKPPAGLKKSGQALWKAVSARLDLDHRDATLLEEACRIKDQLDRLAAGLAKSGPPDLRLLSESRHQQITLTRVLASLRLPEDLAHPDRRPQRRGAARGTHRMRQDT